MNQIELILSDLHLAWVHLDDGDVVARGDAATLAARSPDRTRVFVPPIDAVVLSPVDFGDLPPAQARAAARLAAADETLLDGADLHVDVSADGLTAASTSRTAMTQWIADYDPDVILPAPFLLPRRDDNVQVAVLGALKIVRGQQLAGGWDDIITPMLMGETPVSTISAADFDQAMAAAAANPEMNLRHGEFERRTRFVLDRKVVQLMGWLAVALLIITLLIPLISTARLNQQSNTLEATGRTSAQTAVGASVPEDQALARLDARLAALRGGGAGFVRTSTAVNLAVQATPNVELTTMTFSPDGQLRVGARATKAEEIGALIARMRALGLDVNRSAINPAQGQPVVELKVKGQ